MAGRFDFIDFSNQGLDVTLERTMPNVHEIVMGARAERLAKEEKAEDKAIKAQAENLAYYNKILNTDYKINDADVAQGSGDGIQKVFDYATKIHAQYSDLGTSIPVQERNTINKMLTDEKLKVTSLQNANEHFKTLSQNLETNPTLRMSLGGNLDKARSELTGFVRDELRAGRTFGRSDLDNIIEGLQTPEGMFTVYATDKYGEQERAFSFEGDPVGDVPQSLTGISSSIVPIKITGLGDVEADMSDADTWAYANDDKHKTNFKKWIEEDYERGADEDGNYQEGWGDFYDESGNGNHDYFGATKEVAQRKAAESDIKKFTQRNAQKSGYGTVGPTSPFPKGSAAAKGYDRAAVSDQILSNTFTAIGEDTLPTTLKTLSSSSGVFFAGNDIEKIRGVSNRIEDADIDKAIAEAEGNPNTVFIIPSDPNDTGKAQRHTIKTINLDTKEGAYEFIQLMADKGFAGMSKSDAQKLQTALRNYQNNGGIYQSIKMWNQAGGNVNNVQTEFADPNFDKKRKKIEY